MQISEKIMAHVLETKLDLYPSFIGKTMNIEITSSCNEKCIYCQYSTKGFHSDKKMIDDELFYRITREAKELGITDIGLYMTAEPLMNPKVYEYTRFLKKELQFPYVYTSTNGVLLTPENLVKLVDAGIDSIKFSVSAATAETFKKHHGLDAFNQVLNNIKFANQYRKENNLDYKLFMFSILTRYNEHERDAIFDLYSPYLDEIVFSNVMSSPSVIGVEKYLSVIESKPTIVKDINGKTLPCMQLFERIVVNEDGFLCACCHETRSNLTKLEDLNKMSLKDAVYGDKMLALRKRHLEKDVEGIYCMNCINGTNHAIKPLDPDYVGEPFVPEVFDISDQIIDTFHI